MIGRDLAAVVIQPTNQGRTIRIETLNGPVEIQAIKGVASGAIELIPATALHTDDGVDRLVALAIAEWRASRPPAPAPADTGWIEVRSADSTEAVTMIVNLNGCTAVTMPIGDGRIMLQLATGETIPVVATEELKARVRSILGAVDFTPKGGAK